MPRIRSHFRPGFSKINFLRGRAGNTLALVAGITSAILIVLLIFTYNYSRTLGGSSEHRSAVEAAAMAAAQDLSRIVVEDPNYGYISLTDYPPIGKATLAADGEPLPVLSINTVTATARLDTIIANELGDDTMIALARADSANAKAAAGVLKTALINALDADRAQTPHDLDGNTIDVIAHAKDVYIKNLVKMSNGNPVLKDFKLTLGWLRDGSSTITKIPEPQSMAAVGGDQQINGRYKAFVNIPANNEDFTFAGLGDQVSLVEHSRYQDDDGTRVCSIVRVRAKHSFDKNPDKVIETIACAQPSATEDAGPPGQLNVSFPSGNVPGINSIRDLFKNDQLRTNKLTTYAAKGGDWPSDSSSGSTLIPASIPYVSSSPTVAQGFGAGFYHWLRSNRHKAHIDDVKDLVDTQFADFGDPGTVSETAFFDLMPKAYARHFHRRSNGNHRPQHRYIYIVSGLVNSGSDTRMSNLNGSFGISAFWHMTSLKPSSDKAPKNSFTCSLGSDGNIYSADGATLLTHSMIDKFWQDVSDSSQAANSTLHAAQDAIGQANSEIAHLQQQGGISPILGSGYASSSGGGGSSSSSISSAISSWNNKKSRAEKARDNAQHVLDACKFISDNQQNLSKIGFKPDADGNYTLAANYLRPHKRAASKSEILDGHAPSGDSPANTDWTAAGSDSFSGTSSFYFYPDNVDTSSAPSDDGGSSTASGTDTEVTNLFMNSQGDMTAFVSTDSPFKEVPVAENQFYGISNNAITTTAHSSNLPVTWVAVMRDEAAILGKQKGGKHAGQPPAGSPANFCQLPQYGGSGSTNSAFDLNSGGQIMSGGNILSVQPRKSYICGGMAFDFQLRSPMIFNSGYPASAGAVAPDVVMTGEDVTSTLTPPIPADFQ